jgi:hypothetical protein
MVLHPYTWLQAFLHLACLPMACAQLRGLPFTVSDDDICQWFNEDSSLGLSPVVKDKCGLELHVDMRTHSCRLCTSFAWSYA